MTRRTYSHKGGVFSGLQRRLTLMIIAAFAVPYLFTAVLTYVVEDGLGTIKDTTIATSSNATSSLNEAADITKKMFKLGALTRAETMARQAALVISLRNLKMKDLGSDPSIMRIVQHERVGDESRISIVDPKKGVIIVDKYNGPGASIDDNLPLIGRLIYDKGYVRILQDLAGRPTLEGNPGTASDVYSQMQGGSEGRENGNEPKEIRRKEKFAIITPIPGSPYSLSIVTSMGGLTQTVFMKLKVTLEGINSTLANIELKSLEVKHFSLAALAAGALFGIIMILLLLRMTRVRILDQVDELAETSESIRRGEFDRRVSLILMTDEFRELGVTINRMLDTITKLIESEEDKERLQGNIIRLLDIVSKASEGDLTGRGHVSEDVLGNVVDAFNMMLNSISKLVVRVKEAGRLISQGAVSILDDSRKIAIDAKRQGREIHNITGRIQQASRSMQRVSISSDLANEEAQRATFAARDGGKKVDETIRNMQTMRTNVQATSKTIKSLGDRSLEINAIVELINDISARTNILSLNAAIEASKAGEQGKGFAVVADEIRKLAERTTNATREISSFIEDIQIDTHDAVLAMEEVVREVEQGWKQSDQAGTTLREIQTVISAAAEKIMEISKVSRDMVQQMDDVVIEIKSIYQVARETTEGIYRASNETKNLMGPLDQLNTLLSHFKLQRKYKDSMQKDWFEQPASESAMSIEDTGERADGILENPEASLLSHMYIADDDEAPGESEDGKGD